ncbi:MAG TPA: PQQ-dependent dehydrogenase, methanol/ethanol family, partial [Rhizomicrobium sp.]|nr:PQQ-dependent dehydrogenase, methanol/ethanol family [Rhizomicrobium sp.]
PLMVAGTLYITTAWSMVKAFEAQTGKLLWSYDPKVPRKTLVKACCDAANRGAAAWGETLFVGTLDGRLIALDRKTGAVKWSVVTIDQSKPYTITGAPRVIQGKVIIGNGGAEFGVRGYVTAYDAATGKQLWRFYTVPGDPSKGFEGKYLEKAASSWKGDYWTGGGGGTVWDAMAYDPDLDLLYIGVGNGSPWNHGIRSQGEGDNLYLSSIVAIKPETGEYVWHYQTTPADSWDFTATQHIILADLKIDGKMRKVLMQAPKNGFFYVLDRKTGQLLSANNYVPITWATGVDMRTGRPIENPAARYYKTGKPWIGSPGPAGAHSWQPMAFDPKQGLVFIPANIAAFPYFPEQGWRRKPMGYNLGVSLSAGAMPADKAVRDAARAATTGALIAWDPVAKKERWRISYKGPWNGGLLATAGGILFQGNAAGQFAAYSTENGAKLWSFATQTGVIAPPMTYSIDGDQYVAVLAGWGGVWALAPGVLSDISGPTRNVSRLLVFKLGGKGKLPPLAPTNQTPLDPPADSASPATVAAGAYSYGRYCSACHGDAAVAGGINPDLRHSGIINEAGSFKTVVYDGAFSANGMVSFKAVLSPDQVEQIRHYIIRRANEDKALERTGSEARAR